MKKKFVASAADTLLPVPACVRSAGTGLEAQQTHTTDESITFGLLYGADFLFRISGGLQQETPLLGNSDTQFSIPDMDTEPVAGDQFSVFFGLYDLDPEFCVGYRVGIFLPPVQPNIRYVINRGSDAQIKHAAVPGAR